MFFVQISGIQYSLTLAKLDIEYGMEICVMNLLAEGMAII